MRLLGFLLFCIGTLSAAEVDVYLLGGQSNMQGIARVNQHPNGKEHKLTRAHFFTGNKFEPIVFGKTKTSKRANNFGPEIGFAQVMNEAGKEVYLIKYAASGMPLHPGWNGNKWLGLPTSPKRTIFYPGQTPDDPAQGTLYAAMLKHFAAGIQTLKAAGHTPKVRGFVWMQGEQDSKNAQSAKTYATNLKLLKQRLAADMDTPQLPLVFGQVLPHSPAHARFTHRDVIRQQMAAADYASGKAESIPQANMISTDSCPLLKDKVHYNAKGQIMLGRAMAKAMLKLNGTHSPQSSVIDLWPNKVPNQESEKKAAVISPNKTGHVKRLSEVTSPSLTVYPPKLDVDKQTAIIVIPGGAYNILAIDLEGDEIAQWLSELGYTACVLQYRVPQQQRGALQDAQRAIRTVRAHAKQWQVTQVGVIGFSAGGNLAARVSAQHDAALYPSADSIDSHNPRPDFAAMIYPAYLDRGPKQTLTPDLKIDSTFPPSFLFVTSDDPFANGSLVFAKALQSNKRPYQLHVYPKGGHGYGLRPANPAASTWPSLCAQWLKQLDTRSNKPSNTIERNGMD